jgi:hypothetical protein
MPAAKTDVYGDLRQKCICARCPTYNDCARKGEELLYCLDGKTACKLERYGCICGTCPVEKLEGFTGVYFCVAGKADIK